MSNPDIRRYEREIGKAVEGFRRRKQVLEAFRKSLLLFLEEIDKPTYEDLEKAFGPPKQMAQELMESTPNLPKPFRRKEKMGLFIVLCVITLVVAIGVFCSRNMPEAQVTVSDGTQYTEDILSSNYVPGFRTTFDQDDFSWVQGKEYVGYLILFENNNQVETKVSVEYSRHRLPHSLIVPAGGTQAIQVDDAQPTKHTISFDALNGAMSGTVQVFLCLRS